MGTDRMDTKTALDQVSAAEFRVCTMIAAARKEEQDLLLEARRRQERRMEEAGTTAKEEVEALRKKAEEELDGEIAGLQADSRRQIDVLRNRAEGRMKRALYFLKSKLD